MTTPCAADLALRRDVARETGSEIVPSPFDVLTESMSGAAFRQARAEAKALCSACPIRDACYEANRGEPWVQALEPSPERRPYCGTARGYRSHRYNREYPCADCVSAFSAYNAEYKRQLRARKAS